MEIRTSSPSKELRMGLSLCIQFEIGRSQILGMVGSTIKNQHNLSTFCRIPSLDFLLYSSNINKAENPMEKCSLWTSVSPVEPQSSSKPFWIFPCRALLKV